MAETPMLLFVNLISNHSKSKTILTSSWLDAMEFSRDSITGTALMLFGIELLSRSVFQIKWHRLRDRTRAAKEMIRNVSKIINLLPRRAGVEASLSTTSIKLPLMASRLSLEVQPLADLLTISRLSFWDWRDSKEIFRNWIVDKILQVSDSNWPKRIKESKTITRRILPF